MPAPRYSAVAITLHWVIALCILTLAIAALAAREWRRTLPA